MNSDSTKYCSICPRNCQVNRISGEKGFCNSDLNYNISTICCHKGEEPPVSGKDGICNVFFNHCNLQCVYCQNIQISSNESALSNFNSLDDIIYNITELLDSGCKAVGFVSPSHYIQQVKEIISTLKSLGYYPYFVYNTNSYDKIETIKSLDGLIDIYLPDFKYMEYDISLNYSDAVDYPQIALAAIKEMYKQKSSEISYDIDGQATSGLIIRHLVLPGHTDNSIKVLNAIAESLSNDVHISLMSQYYPINSVLEHPKLGRTITNKEYDIVITEMERLGFENGWIQELDSNKCCRPNFNNINPFELS
jgi:putative pyruvate formate lyase activating enzyme